MALWESHFSKMWGSCAFSPAGEVPRSQLGWELPVRPQFSQYGEEECDAFPVGDPQPSRVDFPDVPKLFEAGVSSAGLSQIVGTP